VCSVRDECIVCVVTVALVTVAGQSFAKRLLAPVSTYVPTTIKYETMIDESQKGGDIVSDGRGFTYFFKID